MSWETLLGMLDLDWVIRQTAEAPVPFLLWSAFMFSMAFTLGMALGARRARRLAESRIAELENGPVREYEELMKGVMGDVASARNWLRGFDAQQLAVLWQSYRDCDWPDGASDVRTDMNMVMNTFPKVFREEYVRIVGEEPAGWKPGR